MLLCSCAPTAVAPDPCLGGLSVSLTTTLFVAVGCMGPVQALHLGLVDMLSNFKNDNQGVHHTEQTVRVREAEAAA
jgi:hypothetical protein